MQSYVKYIYSKSWKAIFWLPSSTLIIEDLYLQTFVHTLLYLNSAITSTTPELRAIYTAVGQMLEGDAALTALSITKEWVKIHESPMSGLSCAVSCANDTACKKN